MKSAQGHNRKSFAGPKEAGYGSFVFDCREQNREHGPKNFPKAGKASWTAYANRLTDIPYQTQPIIPLQPL
jgi:hypothetical protein